MRCKRTTYKLSEVINLISGGTPKTSIAEYWNGAIPWLSVKDFNNDERYVYTTEKSITKLGLENSSAKMLACNDIIISARGTVGEIAMVPFPMAFNQSCYGIRGKKDIIVQTYLYYLLKNSIRILKSQSHGSVFDTITLRTFDNIIISLPPIDQQQHIADILVALDDKIENNTALNHHLEQMAQAIFKNWFVDFEPFGGEMPDDWRIGILDDIIELFDFKRVPLSSNQRNNMKKMYPYYGAATLMDYVDDYLFDGIYLLLGEDGTVVDNLGFPVLQYVWGKFWVNNHAHIMQGRNGFTVESLYMFLKQTNITSIITGAVQPKINQVNLKALNILIPSTEILSQFNILLDPLFTKIRANHNENLHLVEIRDILLPKLMSGELSVADVEIGDAK